MPRLTKSLPKYRKHKASKQAVVTLSGIDFYLGPHGTEASRQKYDRLIAEWIANGRQVIPPAAEISIAELANAYRKFAISYYVKDGRPTDEVACIRSVIRATCKLYSSLPAREFGPKKLVAVRQELIATGNCRGYINKQMLRLKRMFRWAVEEEMIDGNVYQSIACVKGLAKGRTSAIESPPITSVDDATVEETCRFLPKTIADMVRIQRLSVMRPEEVCAIRPCDVDRSRRVWRYVPKSHKMEHKDRQRVIFIGPQAQPILAPYLLLAPDSNCFQPDYGNVTHINPDSYRAYIHRACEKRFPTPPNATREEKLEWRRRHRWNPNQLRHAGATMIRQRYGIEDAQGVCGHSKASTTEIYAERDFAKAEQIILEVG